MILKLLMTYFLLKLNSFLSNWKTKFHTCENMEFRALSYINYKPLAIDNYHQHHVESPQSIAGLKNIRAFVVSMFIFYFFVTYIQSNLDHTLHLTYKTRFCKH